MQRKLFDQFEDGSLTALKLWEYEFATFGQTKEDLNVPFFLRFQQNRTRRLLSEMWRFVIENSEVHRIRGPRGVGG